VGSNEQSNRSRAELHQTVRIDQSVVGPRSVYHGSYGHMSMRFNGAFAADPTKTVRIDQCCTVAYRYTTGCSLSVVVGSGGNNPRFSTDWSGKSIMYGTVYSPNCVRQVQQLSVPAPVHHGQVGITRCFMPECTKLYGLTSCRWVPNSVRRVVQQGVRPVYGG